MTQLAIVPWLAEAEYEQAGRAAGMTQLATVTQPG
jgi:hypothetical protein